MGLPSLVWRAARLIFFGSRTEIETTEEDFFEPIKDFLYLERDTKTVQENIQEKRESLLTLWPTLDICNKYLSSKQACLIIRSMSNLDEKIGKGFILNENNNPDWKWRDLELVRMYDWGKIHYTWCTDRKNEHVEKEIEKMIIVLNESLDEIQDDIFSMVINYSDFPFPTW